MFYLFLAKQFIRTQWRSQNEYRFSFIMGILAQGTNFVFRYLALYLLVSRFGSLNGWNSRELLLIYSFSQFTYAIGSTFTHDLCRQLPNLARTGDLNSYLIRPVHSLFLAIFTNFNVGYITHFTISATVMIFSFISLGVTLNLWGILWLVITLVSGGIISGCVFLISSLPSVVAIGNVSLKNITYVFKDVVQYPLPIFGTPLQIILTVFIPLGFTTFYPLQPLLGKQDMGIFPVFIQYLSPLVAIVMVLLLLLAWRTVINKYESTGT